MERNTDCNEDDDYNQEDQEDQEDGEDEEYEDYDEACDEDYSGSGFDNEQDLDSRKKAREGCPVPLTGDQHLLCSSSVKGYSMNDGKWCKSLLQRNLSVTSLNISSHLLHRQRQRDRMELL